MDITYREVTFHVYQDVKDTLEVEIFLNNKKIDNFCQSVYTYKDKNISLYDILWSMYWEDECNREEYKKLRREQICNAKF